jgi:signal transduction histidine kinase
VTASEINDLVDRLAAHRTLGSAPRAELEWLAAHGTVRHLAEGELVSRKGVPVEALIIMLSGHVAVYLDRGGARHKVMEWTAGDATGLLPYSRLVNAPGESIVLEPTEVLAVQKECFPEMIRECHQITSILVHKMIDRAKAFTSNDLQIEKMQSLGKLSAGLAHELNNPASAIERSAALLGGRLEEAQRATRALGAAGLTDSQLVAIDAVRTACNTETVQGVLSPIQQAEREDAIADWLEDHGVADAASAAGPLADTAVTLEALNRIAAAVSGPALESVLHSVAAECSVRGIASEIQEAAGRISGLVAAIKGFTHMDQAAVAERVDLGAGLRNTIAVLRSKARMKSAEVVVDLESVLPHVRGFAGEINQIWANLIDNALDAILEGGRVDVTAKRDRQRVIVRVVDNGPGIPAAVREKMFEPFFTTKPVGQGTGLGLDIVRRLVTHNDAEIEVDSVPGRTEFRVTLQPDGDGEGGLP